MKTPEELLKPRYKVIADYPGCKFKIGNILTYVREIAQTYDLWRNEKTGVEIIYSGFGAFPHLFKKLEWWEDREPGEMPEYVKGYDRVYKMVKWTHNACGEYFDEVEQAPNRVMFEMKNIIPATAAEYDEYVKSLTPNNK